MAIDGHSALFNDATSDLPSIQGSVRLDGKASFPTGWVPGSWSFENRFSHFVLIVEGFYNGYRMQSEYCLSNVKKRPTYCERRELYSLFFNDSVVAYIKAPGPKLKLLDSFLQLRLNGLCNNNAFVGSPINCDLKVNSNKRSPDSPLGSPITRSLARNTFAKKSLAEKNNLGPNAVKPICSVTNSLHSLPSTSTSEDVVVYDVPSDSPPSFKDYNWSPNSHGANQDSRAYRTRASVKRSSVEEGRSVGFSNLGNTCYMNAILQAILGQKPFCQELFRVVTKFSHSIPEDSLLRILTQLLQSKTGDLALDRQELLRAVKNKVASTTVRFSDNSEHDAQEFLALLIDQLADEVKRVNDAHAEFDMPNPVLRNFAFTICHYLKCKQCEEVCSREEQFFDLPLNIALSSASSGSATSGRALSLQTLVGGFFIEESVSCTCARCGCSESIVQHRMTKLPRILILHVKRYMFNERSCVSEKSEDKITIPTFLTLQDYCVSDAMDCVDLTASAKKLVNFSTATADVTPQSMAKSTPKSAARRLFSQEPSVSCASNDASSVFSPPNKRRSQRSLSRSDKDEQHQEEDIEYKKQLMEAIELSLMDKSTTISGGDSLDSSDIKDHFATTELQNNEKEGNMPRSFRLCAVVSHIGISSATGHYVSDVYDWKAKEWYCFDDSTVNKTTESFVQRKREKCGYLFFYVDKNLLSEPNVDLDNSRRGECEQSV